jgi:hypothetical protein
MPRARVPHPKVLAKSPHWYNDMHNFKSAVDETLCDQREMLYWLAEPQVT